MLNLDTHILVFALSGGLRPAESAVLERNGWSISAIVLWELAKLVQLGRLEMDLDDREVARALARVHVWPIDIAVARASVRLDIRGDPADGIIAATSTVHNVPLLTSRPGHRTVAARSAGSGHGVTFARAAALDPASDSPPSRIPPRSADGTRGKRSAASRHHGRTWGCWRRASSTPCRPASLAESPSMH